MDVVRNHIKIALVETITHIFKYSLPHTKFLKIEGVIAVTADTDVFIVHVDQDYDLNRDKNDDTEDNTLSLNEDIIKAEPPPSPNEIDSEPIRDDPSILALLEHFQSIKKENQTNAACENMVPSSRGKAQKRNFSELPHSESFYEDGSWNVEENSPEDNQTLNSHNGNPLTRLIRSRSPYKKLKKNTRRTSLLEPLRQTSSCGDGGGFIITESSHICAYPNCYKRFKLRRDLLRHQTKKHGRIPVRRRKKNSTDAIMDGDDEPMEGNAACDSEFVPDEGGEDYVEGPV